MLEFDRTTSLPVDSIEMDTLGTQNNLQIPDKAIQHLDRKNYFIGIGLLLIVVLLWTLSNFVTQDLYEGGYNKPFFVTYMNTSAFFIYLLPFFFHRWWTRGHGSDASIERGNNEEYQPLHGEDLDDSDDSGDHNYDGPLETLPPLNVKETAHLALAFCLLWFIANWTVNASLGYTSVASATVLSSTSGFFTLGVGRLFKVEKLNLLKIAAVFASFTGVLLVSLSDSKSPAGTTTRPGITHTQVMDSRATFGDVLALTSALFYALYVILLKVRIKTESRIDVRLFFGFVGLLNILICWPIGVFLNFTNLEIFELPSGWKVWQAILINMAITLSSDYLYVLAMLKTTPLVVTIGLSLTIPVAVLGDFIRLRPTQAQVLVGALLVLVGFIAIGVENKEDREVQREDD